MKLPTWLDMTRQPSTWAGHGLVTLLVGIALALAFDQFEWGPMPAGLLLGSGVMTFYYTWVREPWDKMIHIFKAQDYDTPDADGITPRIDKIGDTMGPWFVLAGEFFGVILTVL